MIGDAETVLCKIQYSRYKVCGAGGGRIENIDLEMAVTKS